MRDVSKILTDADLLKLRELLKQAPTVAVDPNAFEEYPKMLFHPDWLTCYRLIKDHPDPVVKKDASEKLRNVQIIVHDFETEEEYLADGWKSDPNDIIIDAGEVDPRIPTGREGRRAARQTALDRDTELRSLRRRYAELTGHRLADEPQEVAQPVVAAAMPVTPAPAAKRKAGAKPAPVVASSKRERVAAATQRATGRSASV